MFAAMEQLVIGHVVILLNVAHIKITLVDLQLDAQYSCLFTYNTFIKKEMYYM
jgi:uncharacterized ferritin-like protein (DUF455 family)